MLLILRQNLAEAVVTNDSSSGQGFLFLTHLLQGNAQEANSGGWLRHRPGKVKKRDDSVDVIEVTEQIYYVQKQAELEAELQSELVRINSLSEKKLKQAEHRLSIVKDELDSLKILNALIKEQLEEEEEMMMLLLLAA
jgi:hypothetical protein